MQAILIISHGSRSSKTIDEVQKLIGRIKAQTDIEIVNYAFLELSPPSIPDGIDKCVKEGAKEIFVLLNFLNAGTHVDNDIPKIIEEAQKKHKKVPIKLSTPVGQHRQIPNLFLDLLKKLQIHA